MNGIFENLYNKAPVWLQDIAISAYGYHLYNKRYDKAFRNVMEDIQKAQNWSLQETHSFQQEKLHEMVKHCRKNIPYYQNIFSEYSIHENDITTISDIVKLPVLTKKILKANTKEFYFKDHKPYMVQTTSGSTGSPLSLWVNEYTYKLAMALVVFHEESNHIKFGARRASFAGRMIKPIDDLKPPFSRYNKAENQRLFSSYHLNKETFQHYQAELSNFSPEELIGYPSAIYDLATLYFQANIKPSFQLKGIVTNSETLLSWQRQRIESVFNCTVYDYYGTAEYVVFAGQGEKGIYNLNPLLGITEVEPDNMENTIGPIRATTLTNTYMPLLRYEVGDRAEKSSSDGYKTVQHLKRIDGRIDDYIETNDGRKIGRIDHIFKGLEGIHESQVIQDKINHCQIKVALHDINQFSRKKLEDNFKARTGEEFSVTIQIVDRIPRGANGKFKGVIREVAQEDSK